MLKAAVAAVSLVTLFVTALDAQTKRGPVPTTYDVTVTANNQPYTGTMALTIAAGKVTGTMKITAPAEVNGDVIGTVKGGKMLLDFPYRNVSEACDGRVAMDIGWPPKAGAAATGTVSITGCGPTPDSKLPGTIEVAPQKKR